MTRILGDLPSLCAMVRFISLGSFAFNVRSLGDDSRLRSQPLLMPINFI